MRARRLPSGMRRPARRRGSSPPGRLRLGARCAGLPLNLQRSPEVDSGERRFSSKRKIAMKKISIIGALMGAAMVCAIPISLGWSLDKVLSISLNYAEARIGRPLTPGSVAGVNRRGIAERIAAVRIVLRATKVCAIQIAWHRYLRSATSLNSERVSRNLFSNWDKGKAFNSREERTS
jgi:hypothetical protein